MVTAQEYFDYAMYLLEKANHEDAVVMLCRAIEQRGDYTEAYNNLGVLFREQGKLIEAEACFRKSIDLEPKRAAHYNNLALVFLDTNRHQEAVLCLQEALKFDPLLPEIYNSLGLVYEAQGKGKEAESAYAKAVRLNPEYFEAYYNWGTFLKSRNEDYQAEKYLQMALEIMPDDPAVKFSLATLQLRDGRYETGWKLYDQVRLKRSRNRSKGLKSWTGEPVQGSKMLLFFDQGFGDTIQFVRYIDQLIALGAEIVLWVQIPLQALLTNSYPEVSVYCGKEIPPGVFDYACPLLSLPAIMQTTIDTIPQRVPYIKPEKIIADKWRLYLQLIPPAMKRIGVVWAGNPQHSNDKNRSIPCSIFKKLFSLTAACWISLQVGERTGDLGEMPAALLDVSADLVDFSQTAGLIENLDLVITVDSAVAHLAGAMGKHTWLLLPYSPDWRWLLHTKYSPWYPATKIFRQKKIGDWKAVIEEVMAELQQSKLLQQRL
ncbi:MAG: tetratricopeptide repeat protein [Selenomonadaceae bacterium]